VAYTSTRSILFAYKYQKNAWVIFKKCYCDVTSGYRKYPVFLSICT